MPAPIPNAIALLVVGILVGTVHLLVYDARVVVSTTLYDSDSDSNSFQPPSPLDDSDMNMNMNTPVDEASSTTTPTTDDDSDMTTTTTTTTTTTSTTMEKEFQRPTNNYQIDDDRDQQIITSMMTKTNIDKSRNQQHRQGTPTTNNNDDDDAAVSLSTTTTSSAAAAAALMMMSVTNVHVHVHDGLAQTTTSGTDKKKGSFFREDHQQQQYSRPPPLTTSNATNSSLVSSNPTVIVPLLLLPLEKEEKQQPPPPPFPQPPFPPLPTIVVQLRGELGNHLSSIAHGLGLQWELQRIYGMHPTQLVLRHQKRRPPNGPTNIKSTTTTTTATTRDTLDACFPNLSSLLSLSSLLLFEDDDDDEEGDKKKNNNNSTSTRSTTFSSIRSQQRQWLTAEQRSKLHQVNGHQVTSHMYQVVTNESIHTGLQQFVELWNDPSRPLSTSTTISIPYLHVTTLASNYMVDRYYEEIRDFFRFHHDPSSCCALQADPEETVFVSDTYMVIWCHYYTASYCIVLYWMDRTFGPEFSRCSLTHSHFAFVSLLLFLVLSCCFVCGCVNTYISIYILHM
jgi:hypothetical protein